MTALGKGDYLGEFELVVLATVAALEAGAAYGMRIRMAIEDATGRRVSIGAVYATLRRLEAKGYVGSELGDPTPERGGRAKRHFTIRKEGARALRETRAMIEALWAELPRSL